MVDKKLLLRIPWLKHPYCMFLCVHGVYVSRVVHGVNDVGIYELFAVGEPLVIRGVAIHHPIP